ncbi:uncharacterized protein N7479_004801 [Penicillium vulpinum]|uniref:Extracellular membrane protein CFEM domain-containing protein n=1 Tax=Penicillium vulpinum TaxID=29845 RepID=A0A1V6RS65_9EURO|nr:uncharacterized protein N7479_004801 [Penicillium vulpinum]KAJ5964925.1 hypothetical protein N7479_004801 [Penicillium vulpinum]OQE04621.1 hypothetical protein PENVUL_c031G10026 [Penicillium vulpinum]
MKFSILALSALLTFAAADTTTVNPSTITGTPEIECAKSCEATDICCTAKCYKVPCPSDNQVNDTNKCVSACPQGTGSPADAQKYADCEQSCYSSHFWGGSSATTTHSSVTSTGTSSTATQTGSDFDSKSSGNNDEDDSSSGTTTSSSGFSQQTTNAAPNVKLGASTTALFGLVVAAFAL